MKNIKCQLMPQERQDNKNGQKKCVIKGPDSQAAANVEVLEIAFRFLRVQQDAGDQESRQHKEKVDSHPAVGRQAGKGPNRKSTQVMDHYRKDGNAPDAVELRDSLRQE